VTAGKLHPISLVEPFSFLDSYAKYVPPPTDGHSVLDRPTRSAEGRTSTPSPTSRLRGHVFPKRSR